MLNDRITPTQVTSTVVRDLNESFARLNRSSEELSTGRAFIEPSENPLGAARSLDLESVLEGLAGYASNVKEAISRENGAAGALSSIGTILQKVRALVVQSNGINTKSELESIAGEVEGLTESVKQYANARFGHEYVLSGTMTETAPYSSGAEDSYHGNEGSILRAIAPGAAVNLGLSAKTLLGEGSSAEDGKLLDVLRTIAKHMREDSPEALKALDSTDPEALEANEDTLMTMQAHVGTIVAQLRGAEASIEERRTTMAAALSNVKDANFAQVSLEYSSEQAAWEAALRTSSSIVQMSLLEFLR